MWNLKKIQINLFTKKEAELQTLKINIWLPKGKQGGRERLSTHTLLYTK